MTSEFDMRFPLNEFVTCHENEYFAAPGLNGSALEDMIKSPKHFHYHYILGNHKKDTAAKIFGRKMHLAILETDRFLKHYTVVPEFWGVTKKGEPSQQSADAKAKRAKWFEELDPNTIVLEVDEVEKLMKMIASIKQDEVIRNLLKRSRFEQCLWVIDPETGELLKCRLDSVVTSDHWIIDLKSAEDASPLGFSKAIGNYNYHVKAAWYCKIYEIAFGVVPKYAWIAIEKEEPYCTGLYVADDATLDDGEQVAKRAFKKYLDCKAKDDWPGYTKGAQMITLMPYHRTYFED